MEVPRDTWEVPWASLGRPVGVPWGPLGSLGAPGATPGGSSTSAKPRGCLGDASGRSSGGTREAAEAPKGLPRGSPCGGYSRLRFGFFVPAARRPQTPHAYALTPIEGSRQMTLLWSRLWQSSIPRRRLIAAWQRRSARQLRGARVRHAHGVLTGVDVGPRRALRVRGTV